MKDNIRDFMVNQIESVKHCAAEQLQQVIDSEDSYTECGAYTDVAYKNKVALEQALDALIMAQNNLKDLVEGE